MKYFFALEQWSANSLTGFFVVYFTGCLLMMIATIIHAKLEDKPYCVTDYAFTILGSFISMASYAFVIALLSILMVFDQISRIFCYIFKVQIKEQSE